MVDVRYDKLVMNLRKIKRASETTQKLPHYFDENSFKSDFAELNQGLIKVNIDQRNFHYKEF